MCSWSNLITICKLINKEKRSATGSPFDVKDRPDCTSTPAFYGQLVFFLGRPLRRIGYLGFGWSSESVPLYNGRPEA